MAFSRFATLLGITTLVSALALYLFHQWPLTQPYTWFSIVSLGFFFLLTLAIYFFGRAAAKSKSPTSFIQAILGILGAKLFGACLLILIFDRVFHPESRWFLLPFFSLYLIYTILETYLLMKLGKMKNPPKTA